MTVLDSQLLSYLPPPVAKNVLTLLTTCHTYIHTYICICKGSHGSSREHVRLLAAISLASFSMPVFPVFPCTLHCAFSPPISARVKILTRMRPARLGVGTRSVARLGRAAPCGSLLRLITWRLVRLVGLLGGLDADEVVMDGGWVFFGCCGMQGHGFEFVCLLLFLRMEGGRRIVPVWFLKLYPCHPSLPSFLPSMHTAIDTACSCSQT